VERKVMGVSVGGVELVGERGAKVWVGVNPG